jgi:hypothetical protein
MAGSVVRSSQIAQSVTAADSGFDAMLTSPVAVACLTFRCPRTGREVASGVLVPVQYVSRLRGRMVRFDCAGCGGVHVRQFAKGWLRPLDWPVAEWIPSLRPPTPTSRRVRAAVLHLVVSR